jgi:APA family basic amino acid/polyamine antiporter
MSITATPHEGPSVGEPAPAFQQKLGLFDATMLVSGTMIGSGIFIVSAEVARDLGSSGWLMALWVLTGVMTIMGALSYAELASMMPHAGGQYIFLREAYSPLWGFLYGWTCFLVIQTGSIAAVAVAFAKYLGVLVPKLGTDNILFGIKGGFTISAGQLVGAVIIIGLTWLNCRGLREGKWVQNIFSVAKTVGLIGLILVGLFVTVNSPAIEANRTDVWSGAHETPAVLDLSATWPATAGMLAIFMVAGGAIVGPLFSADAWNNVTFTAGEVHNPRRNLPICLALGTGLVIVLYLLANLAYLASLPIRAAPEVEKQVRAFDERIKELEEKGLTAEVTKTEKAKLEFLDRQSIADRGIAYAKEDRVASAVMELWSPSFGASVMAAAIMISTFGCVNGMGLMGARLYYAMAKDNLFFASVGQLNHRGVPSAGLILQGIWSVVLIFTGKYGDLLDYVMFAVLLFYVLTVIGLFVLRRTQPDAERPYKAFGYPVVPALYVVLCAVIMLDLLIVKPVYTWPGLLIVLTGIPVYFLWRRSVRPTKGERGV